MGKQARLSRQKLLDKGVDISKPKPRLRYESIRDSLIPLEDAPPDAKWDVCIVVAINAFPEHCGKCVAMAAMMLADSLVTKPFEAHGVFFAKQDNQDEINKFILTSPNVIAIAPDYCAGSLFGDELSIHPKDVRSKLSTYLLKAQNLNHGT